MTAALDSPVTSPPTADLLECLQAQLSRTAGGPVAAVTRTASRYSTSFGIENLVVTLSDGSAMDVVFKNLSPEALLPEARRTRPAFVYSPVREIEVYRRLLTDPGLGTARLIASESEASRDRYWLFLEKVDGVELYQVEELEIWREAAHWLAGFHRRMVPKVQGAPQALIRHDASWYRRWMSRAVEFASDDRRAAVERLQSAHEEVVEHLCSLPLTVIHGDLYASNVLVSPCDSPTRVCPVDWERTSVAPGLFDLASLCSGWDAGSASAIADAYGGTAAVGSQSFTFCRLQLCVQWLGWSPDWKPPAEHENDWLREALELVDELNL